MPERDIESLGVMGKGLEAARRFFRRRRRRRRRRPPIKSENPKSSYFFQKMLIFRCHAVKNAGGKGENKKLGKSKFEIWTSG